jgi:predicted  nucleic acid-binding Zn-ribbon protein
MYSRSANPDLALQLERERSERKEEIAGLKREILASTLKVNSISSLVSQKLPVEGVASQEEVARGLMAVTRGLEVVESGLEEERSKRKDEISDLKRSFHETMNGAAGKIRDELTALHEGMSNTPRVAEILDDAPKSDISAEYYSKVRQVQDQLSEEIASLSARIDSAPWAKSIEQAGQSMKDRTVDSEILTARMAKFAEQLAGFQVEIVTSQGQIEASQTNLLNFRQEMHNEIANLRKAEQGQREATQAGFSAFKAEVQKDIQTKSDATALQLNARLDMLNDQILEHTKRIDGVTRRVEAAEPGRAKQIGTVTSASFDEGMLRQLNTRIDLIAERSSEVHDQFSGLTKTLQAVERRLLNFTDTSDRQDGRIDALVDGLNSLQPLVEFVGQEINRHEVRITADCEGARLAIAELTTDLTQSSEHATRMYSEFGQSLEKETNDRTKDIAKLTEKVAGITSGKDPEVESAFERIGSQIRATCLIAVREELSQGQSNSSDVQLPRAGEQWIFTGNVPNIDVYSAATALPKQKIHGLECFSHGKLRRIEVLQTVQRGNKFVFFQGTRGMEFLKGWAALFGENGNPNIQRFDPAKFKKDSWL